MLGLACAAMEVGKRKNSLGPVVWCKLCGRKHHKRATCSLYLRDREAKSGETVKRWAA